MNYVLIVICLINVLLIELIELFSIRLLLTNVVNITFLPYRYILKYTVLD